LTRSVFWYAFLRQQSSYITQPREKTSDFALKVGLEASKNSYISA